MDLLVGSLSGGLRAAAGPSVTVGKAGEPPTQATLSRVRSHLCSVNYDDIRLQKCRGAGTTPTPASCRNSALPGSELAQGPTVSQGSGSSEAKASHCRPTFLLSDRRALRCYNRMTTTRWKSQQESKARLYLPSRWHKNLKFPKQPPKVIYMNTYFHVVLT